MAHLIRHPRLQPFHPIGGRCAHCSLSVPLPSCLTVTPATRLRSCARAGHFGLEEAYQPLQLLGRGGTGQTWLCREVVSGRKYAVKLQQRPLPRTAVRLAYNEIVIQASVCVSSVLLSHIREVALTPSHLAMVLELEAGGSAAEAVAAQVRSGAGGGCKAWRGCHPAQLALAVCSAKAVSRVLPGLHVLSRMAANHPC